MRRAPKKGHLTRRQALAALGSCALTPFALNPLQTLATALADGIFRKAQAAGSMPVRNYVYVYLHGGPSRWTFDLPLAPYESPANLMRNTFVNSRFGGTGPNAGAPIYENFRVRSAGVDLNLPSLWRSNLPRPNGTTVPMTELLANMLMIRGVNMEFDGHGRNSERQLRPSASAPSLQGSVADASERPIPVVAMPASLPNHVYKSNKGIQYTPYTSVTQLLEPFTGKETFAGHYNRADAVRATYDLAMGALAEYAGSRTPGAEHLFGVRHKADALIRKGIGEAMTEVPVLITKYRELVKACALSTIPGVTDRKVPSNSAEVTQNNILSLTVEPGKIVTADDLRAIISAEANLNLIADGCALSEYLITNAMSSSTMFGTAGIGSLVYPNYRDRASGVDEGPHRQNYILDSHYAGATLALIMDSFFFRAVSACLYELIACLKGKGLFEETVIQIGSEFGRIPRDTLDGSDHGWSAGSTTLISGAIRQPLVLGNISRNPTGNEAVQKGSRGTWGSGATVNLDGLQRYLHIGNVTSTVAHLLRVEPPLPNHKSLVREASGGVSPTIELAALKEG